MSADGDGSIVDLFGLPDPGLFATLLAAALQRIMEQMRQSTPQQAVAKE